MFEWIEDEEVRNKAIEEHNSSMKEVKDGVQTQIDEAVSGLKAKNEEILTEKKKLQELADKFKDLDPDKAREALSLINESEYAQMIKDGKIEEVIEKRSSAATAQLKQAIEDLNQQLAEAEKNGSTYKTKFETKVIEDEIRGAAMKAGVRPEALTDVLMRGSTVFSLSEDGQVEARDRQGNLLKNKDKLVVSPSVWVEGLKETAPHYWPESEGAGLSGGDAVSDSDFTKKAAALLAKGDHEGYRKLRAKQKAA